MRENKYTRYIMLYTLSVVADRVAGRELFSSLYDYEDIVPGRKLWIEAKNLDQETFCRGLGGRFLVVENPYYCRKMA